MNDIIEKWVAALRSGEFAQGRGKLRPTENTYCCLGVLCELYQQETGLGHWEPSKLTGIYFFTTDSDGSSGVLPDEVRRWAGLSSPKGQLSGFPRSLASANDNGLPFRLIADIIEVHPELFE